MVAMTCGGSESIGLRALGLGCTVEVGWLGCAVV